MSQSHSLSIFGLSFLSVPVQGSFLLPFLAADEVEGDAGDDENQTGTNSQDDEIRIHITISDLTVVGKLAADLPLSAATAAFSSCSLIAHHIPSWSIIISVARTSKDLAAKHIASGLHLSFTDGDSCFKFLKFLLSFGFCLRLSHSKQTSDSDQVVFQARHFLLFDFSYY